MEEASKANELNTLLMAQDPLEAILESVRNGEMAALVPEFLDLKMDSEGLGKHKDNLVHTAKVVAKCPARLEVRLAAFFHDIGKPKTRKIEGRKVSFYNHEAVGSGMARKILVKLGYPSGTVDNVAKIVNLSGRVRGAEDWTDSAVRRFVADAGESLEDLLEFCYNDTTSSREATRRLVEGQVEFLRSRIAEVQQKDTQAALRPPVDGHQVMERYGLSPGSKLGKLLKLLSPEMSEQEAWALLDQEVKGL